MALCYEVEHERVGHARATTRELLEPIAQRRRELATRQAPSPARKLSRCLRMRKGQLAIAVLRRKEQCAIGQQSQESQLNVRRRRGGSIVWVGLTKDVARWT